MANLDLESFYNIEMSDANFEKLSTFITSNYGIKLPPVKKVMLKSRLTKRLRELNITSFSDYIDYAIGGKGSNNEEIIHMIDLVSTNKTDFFREPAHFDYMTNFLLPEHMQKNPHPPVFKVWSAGCSSGEEPYTLAIVLAEFKRLNPAFDFSIFATDISSRILEKAAKAIYDESKIDVIPIEQKKRYFLKSKDQSKRQVRVVPALRQKVSFQRLNFMDDSYKVHENFDAIFCRNVLIYFDVKNQESVINKLCTKLKHNSHFFLGHSESIINLKVPLNTVKLTIYRRK